MRPIRMLAAAGAVVALAGLGPAVAAHASTATRQWTASFVAKGQDAAGYATAVSPDGSTVYVAGAADFGEVQAYNAATGALIWKYRLNGTKALRSAFTSIAVSPDGSTVFATGYTQIKGGGIEFHQAIVAFNAVTGTPLWQLISPRVSYATGSPVAVSPDSSTIYVTSATLGQTVAYSAATGTVLWTAPAGGTALTVSSDGGAVYVTGEPGSTDQGTEAFDAATGDKIWSWQDSSSGTQILDAAALSPDGTLLFVSGTMVSGAKQGVVTTAFATGTGIPQWSVTIGLAHGSQVDGLATTNSAVIVSATISTDNGARAHWQTVALALATGASQWIKTQAGAAGTADADGLALSPDGRTAYVTGSANATPAGYNMLTIGYNTATGATALTARYDGKTNNFAYGVAVAPDGSQLFITGSANQAGGQGAMTTLAYSTS